MSDEVTRAAERILEATDYIITDDQSDDEWADGMSGPGLRADLTLVARTVLERGQEVERYREALAWYADEANYNDDHAPGCKSFMFDWTFDRGARARAALDVGPRAEGSGPDEPQRQ
jgi:hypothetical protein